MWRTTIAAATLALTSAFAHAESPSKQTEIITAILGEEAEPTGTIAPDREPKWMKTIESSKISAYQSDMSLLRTSIRSNPLWTSMTAVMATAIPESYLALFEQDPRSARKEFEGTHKPKWYEAIPTDVRSYMDANQAERESVFKKDIGDLETGHGGSGVLQTATAEGGGHSGMVMASPTGTVAGTAETGSPGAALAAPSSGNSSSGAMAGHQDGKVGTGDGKTSEAPDSVRIAGATAGALFGAIAVAALLM